jgi:hypothetical protein
MKFQKGNKLAKGGKRNPPGGRPTKEQQEIKKAAAEIAREFIETNVQKFLDSYIRLSTGKFIDPATVRHAIDKILPDEQMQYAQPLEIIFQDFARAAPSQLPPKDIPITVSRNAGGDQKSKEYAAPLIPYRDAKENAEEGQLEKPKPQQVKFHAFAFSSGNGKRRE